MNNKEFCHLHVHNQYSLLDGVGSSEKYAKRAQKMGFEYLALTNHGNVDGLIKHQKACEAEDIIPLFGCEMYIVPDLTVKDKNEKSGHLTILVKDQAGWVELCRLLTIANLEGFYRRPRIDYKTFLAADLSGFIVLTGCSGSFLNRKFGEGFFWNLVEEMKKNLYLEVMPHDMPEQIVHNKRCKELSGKYGIPLIATNDCHYVLPDEDIVQEVLLAIQTHAKWKDKDRWKFDIKGLYLRSCEEMIVAFKKQNSLNYLDYGKALRNTIVVAEKCKDFRIERQKVSLPKIERPKKYEGMVFSDRALLRNLILHGSRYRDLIISDTWNEVYEKRLQYELSVIQKKKFQRYFLIVWDLAKWCRKNDVMIGSGRGSVGGSLIAYLLDITCVDPLKYNLLFSRFINEERIDLPDIDIDFEDRKREQVRQYLEDRYGKDNVSGISTFLQMKGRATVRDVARVFDIPFKEADMFAKAIEYGEDKSAIQKAIKEIQEGYDFESKYPEETKIMLRLEGTVKSCVSGNSRVLVLKERFPLRAKAVTIKSLFDKNFRGKIRSYNFEKGHFFFDKIKDIYFAGIKEAIKIEVGMSTSLTLTSDHRVLSKRGWVKAGELKVGELVATNGRKGQIAWNKGLKGVCTAWNKGLKGVQVAWNKGLSKKDHFSIRQASERWKKNNPLKKIENKIKVAKRSFKHGLYSKKTRKIIKNNLYCQCCKKNKSQEIHHLDKNRYNNKIQNLIAVCVKCHNKYHPKPNPPKLNEFLTIKYRRITKIEKKGQEETYDICMRSRHQNYVCNKIITHNSGQHAAAIVISSEDLKSGTKGNLCRRGKDIIISNWDMEDAEYMGLMKLDILGLSTLSILSETKKLILENHKEEIVFEQISMEDKKVFIMLSKGNTVGVFQLSTSLSTDMCKEVKIDTFEDIVSVLAIARPGALHSGTTKDFINRKHGRRWEKIHSIYDEITKNTYGVLIFQEQVMEVFHKVAGLPYSVADNIRKIIGKKRDAKEFEKYKQQFSDGCKKLKTFNSQEVEWFWDMLLKCANYLFNRSHAVSYGILSQWTAWCKYYYPTEFICASLTYGAEDKKVELIEEAKRLGLKIIPPKIGLSDSLKWKTGERCLYVPFIEIKGFGESAAEKCLTKVKCKQLGFFNLFVERENEIQGKTKVDKILHEIKAFDKEDMPSAEIMNKYLTFNIRV